MRYYAGFGLLLLGVLTFTQLSVGAKRVPPPNLEVVASSALPPQALLPAQDLLLYSNHFTHAWLYLEQEHGARLIVLNVSEPSKIRLAADIPTGLQKPYDLVLVRHKHYAIVRFRDGSGQMLLNLSHPRAPKLVPAPANLPVATLPQGNWESPDIELRTVGGIAGEGQDIQVIEPGATPKLIANISHVTRQTYRQETGTLFLLGDHRLTIVRTHSTELDWELSFVDDESQD